MSTNNEGFEEGLVVAQPITMIEQVERAQIDMQIATAHKYPRPDASIIKARMASYATMDKDTAAACCYALPRGGKMIKGPSVRLAEIAITAYGNIRVATRTVDVDTSSDIPHVVVQAAVHDLENNVLVCIEKRRRITKKKSNNRVDEDDIQLAVNACQSIALRDATFRVIPGVLIQSTYKAAQQVAVGDVKSLVENRTRIIDRLKQMGVMEANILYVVNKAKIEDIDLEGLELLIGLGTAVSEGSQTIEEAFPARPPLPGEGKVGFGFTTAEIPTGDAQAAQTPVGATKETAKLELAEDAPETPAFDEEESKRLDAELAAQEAAKAAAKAPKSQSTADRLKKEALAEMGDPPPPPAK